MMDGIKIKGICDKIILIVQFILALVLLVFSIYTKSMFIIVTILIFAVSVIRLYMCSCKHYYRKYTKVTTDEDLMSYIEFKGSVRDEILKDKNITLKKKILGVFLKVLTVIFTLIFFGILYLFIIDEMCLNRISDIEKDIENTYYVDVEVKGYDPEKNYIDNITNGMRGILAYRVLDGTRDVLKIFPDGFFEEYSDKNILCQKVNIVFFNNSIEVDGISNDYPGLCMHLGEIFIRMDILSDKYVASHELFHAMEYQIAFYYLNADICEEFNEWNDINPAGFEYPLLYTYGQDIPKNITLKNTMYGEEYVNNVYFITLYSTVSPMEDRAELFRYSTGFYDDNDFSFILKSSHIKDKYEMLFEVIDEFYESIDENSTWETYYRKALDNQ